MWPKVSKEEWLENERITDAEVLERCKGRCERCGKCGDKLRPIAVHHKIHKGMGGTRHLYTAKEKEALCGHCHSVSGHNLREGDERKMKKYLCLMVATLVLSIMAGAIAGCGEQQQKVTVTGSCGGSQALACWSAFWNAQTDRNEQKVTEGDWGYYSCPASGMYNFNLSMITAQDMIDDPSWGAMLVNMSPPLGGMTCECKLHLDKSEWEHLQTNLQTCEFEVVEEVN